MSALKSFKIKLSNDSKKKEDDDFITAFKDANFEETGLNAQLDKVAKYIDSISKSDTSLGKIPEGYRSIQRYALVPPFCYVSILQNDEFSENAACNIDCRCCGNSGIQPKSISIPKSATNKSNRIITATTTR